MSSYTSDQSLAEALRTGRSDAFEHLYAEQHAAIYNLCARILGDREEAEDVTHDTFVTAFSNPPAASREVRLRPWLFRVATNACFNRLRSRKHTGANGALIAAVPDGVDEYQRAETAALVEASLATLSTPYRTALVLKDLHGLPPAEIAEVMDVSRPAADVLVHRARGAFKAAFAKLGGTTTPAPAHLGLALAPLTVPAALHTMPSLPHPPVPMHPVPLASPHGPASGLLGKLAAASSKLAIGTAVAALLAAGGAVELVRHEQHHDAAQAAVRSAARSAPARAVLTSQPARLVHTGCGCLDWREHDLQEIEQWCDDQETDHHTETGHDATQAGHDDAEHATATSSSHESDHANSTTETGHDGSAGDGTTTHDSGDSHDSGGTHDSGDDTGSSHE